MRRLSGAFLLFLSGYLCAAEAPKVTLALVGGRIVDGYEGRPIDDGVILVAGRDIAALDPRASVPVPTGAQPI